MKKILTVPYIDQTERWVYGCESVSAVMLLQGLGAAVEPDEFIDAYLPRCASTEVGGVMYARHPRDYYINDPRDLTGWGCYAPCIKTALERALRAKGLADQYEVVDETGKTAAELCALYVDADLPVVFWATLDMEEPVGFSHWRLPDGSDFAWRNGEHCLLLVGYDAENFWFNDPWHDHGCCAYPRAVVEERYRQQGSYAVAVRRRRIAEATAE